MNVLWFERDQAGFTVPQNWPTEGAAMTSTHDLPTVAGWWRGRDIEVRGQLGFVADQKREQTARDDDRRTLWTAFREASVAGGTPPPSDQAARVDDAAFKFIARTPSRLALLPLEDVLALEDQPNLPGTTVEQPNWRRRYSGEAGQLLEQPGRTSAVAAAGGASRSMTPLRATIRLQLHSGFTFDHAAALTPYFTALGVSHLYLSPILTARVGSMHGYDVVDPTRVNPELGGEEAFRRLVREARRNGLGIIVDIVPNHMAIGSDNRWWMDVLARGRESRFAKYFDIDWTPDNPNLCGKVALPILGQPYSEALAAGEITVRCGKNGPSLVCYFDHSLPLAAASAATLADPLW